MSNPIPDFDHNLVLPPHKGNPAVSEDVSPYKCSSLHLCEKFAYSPKRKAILFSFLSFRQKLVSLGLVTGYQWIDGSFLENVEIRENRPPNDLDVVTIFWGYDMLFQLDLFNQFPEFGDRTLSKKTYSLDHFPFDAGHSPSLTVESSRYWIQLFSHNRDSVWKGMLQIDINTPSEDQLALDYLNSI